MVDNYKINRAPQLTCKNCGHPVTYNDGKLYHTKRLLDETSNTLMEVTTPECFITMELDDNWAHMVLDTVQRVFIDFYQNKWELDIIEIQAVCTCKNPEV
jgi:hypothetical protein